MTKVTTRAGTLSGTAEEVAGRSLAVYRGVPYAEAPVGRLRWQPPEAKRSWPGSLDAIAFGPAAPQSANPAMALPAEAFDAGPTDEASCLTLNVWAPAGARDVATMVWIHGGAFMNGAASMATYDAARLAAEGQVVVVSVNYRLGALGFAPVAGHANVGLLDQILALQWVRDNIAEFGGDPGRITAFGESAGAGSILHLLGAPAMQGLLRGAIVQSGATKLTLTAAEGAEVGDRVRRELAAGGDLLTAPTDAVLAAQSRVLGDMAATLGVMPYHPAIDDNLVALPPAAALAAGAAKTVALMIGTTRDEMRLFLDDAAWDLGEERFLKRAKRYLAGHGVDADAAETVLGAYDESAAPADRWAELRTDAEMWLPAVAVSDAHCAQPAPTFAYRFDWPAAPPLERLGACHGIDLPFTFGTLDRCGWAEFTGAGAATEQLSRAMRQAWAAFAATGDPSSPGVGEWPRYQLEGRATMLLGGRREAVDDPRQGVRLAWSKAT